MPRSSKNMQRILESILDFLNSYQEENGYPPSIREIGDRINVSSTSQVSFYLNKLREKEYIEKSAHQSRSLRITEEGLKLLGIDQIAESLWNIPLVGRIVAGAPLPMPDDPTYDPDSTIEVARSLFGINEKPEDLFALEVDGDSMIDAMVNDGDIVIFHRQNQVNNGEMAAIWIDEDNETTLKYFYKESDHYRLQPANPTMQDIIIPKSKNVSVMGKVVAVVRQVTTA
jgi:repressor LexA